MTRAVVLVAFMSLLTACHDDISPCEVPAGVAWEEIGHEDVRMRRRAARSLVRGRSPAPDDRSARALACAAGDEDPWVRRFAVAALGRGPVPPDLAVPALIGAMCDEMPGIREAAMRSLGWLGEDAGAAVPALVEALGSDRIPMALTVTWALGRIGKAARDVGVPALARLADEDHNHAAERAIRRIELTLPEASAGRRGSWDTGWENVLLRINHRGRVEVRGRMHSLRDLTSYIRRRLDVLPPVELPHLVSRIGLVLSFDEDLPWIVARSLLAILVAIFVISLRSVGASICLEQLGASVSPGDFAEANVDVYLSLASGVLVGVLGLIIGWTLGWIVDGRRIAALRESDGD